MGTKVFTILSFLSIAAAWTAGWAGGTVNSQPSMPLDIAERFLSWAVEGDQEDASLGGSISTAGDVNGDGFDDLIVGAPGYQGAATEAGRALLFLGSAAGLATAPAWHASGTARGFGWSVVAAGDVNGDGFDDVLVQDRPDLEPTPWHLYYGTSSGLEGSPSWSSAGTTASAADFNGDGYDDILIGWYHYSNGQSLEGVAWAFLGSPTGPSTQPDWTVEGGFVDASFGRYVGSAGDVNGDGYDDAMVGRWHNVTGASYLFLGSVTGLATTPAWMRDGYVHDVGTAGDTNGDGYDDVVVSTTTSYPSPRPETRVFLGSPSGLSTSPVWVRTDVGYCGEPQSGTAGDVNGDGYADLVIGLVSSYCRTFVFYGSPAGPSLSAQWTGESGNVATAGDINGDGRGDLAVGIPWYTGDWTNEGQARVYHGTYHGLSGTIAGYHLSTPPTIDGDLSDWGLQTPLVLDSDTAQTVRLRGAQTTPPLPADSSANLRAGWDADYIYLAVHVVDDRIINDSPDVWRDDEVELAFDGEHDGGSWSALDHQYTVNADGRLTDRAVPAPPGVTAAVERVPGGWDVEVRIARSALSATSWQAGRTFGFNLGLHDDDDYDDWDSYLIWAGDNTAAGALGFATLRLIEAGAPPATHTPTATATGTSTRTPTPTVTHTPTNTPTPTRTSTPWQSATPTATGAPSRTPTVTATPSQIPTATTTATATRLAARYLPLILHRSP